MIERLRESLKPPEASKSDGFVYLVGLPGSGKTTTANLLGESLGVSIIPEFLETIPDFVINARVNSSLEQQMEAQLWVLNQHIQKNRLLKENGNFVVVDRFWIDPVIYSTLYHRTVFHTIVEQAKQQDWQRGLGVFLFADPVVVKERLMQRMELTESEWNKDWSNFITTLHKTILDFLVDSDFLSIDTSRKTPQEVVDIIKNKL